MWVDLGGLVCGLKTLFPSLGTVRLLGGGRERWRLYGGGREVILPFKLFLYGECM